MIGREGMHDTGVESSFATGSLDGLMIDAGHFDGDDEVGEAFGVGGLGDPLGHCS